MRIVNDFRVRKIRPIPYGIRIKSLILGIFATFNHLSPVFADDNIQFNADLLDVKDREAINLSQFSRAGYLMPGSYQFAVRLNKTEFPEQNIIFIRPDDDPTNSVACLTPTLVRRFNFKTDYFEKLTWWHHGECLTLTSVDGLTIHPDLGSNTLYLTVPRTLLEYTEENWDPPSRWNEGVSGFIFDYSMNMLSSRQSGNGNNHSISGTVTTGMNLGAWRLRADGQARYNRTAYNEQKRWDWNRYYLYRAIPSLNARLTVGESFLESSLFDSFRYTGGSLVTDDNQLPPNLRGYAPEVSGVAKTNAKVTVSQYGHILYETTVAAGPFHIRELNSAISDKLDVTIQEQDGTVRTFQVDATNIPYLTRPGRVRYKFSAGKPMHDENHNQGAEFMTSEFSWGINNGWSVYGGDIFSSNYNATALGVGRDLYALGAISFDLTHSYASLPAMGTLKGNSWRMSYSKRFDDYASQFTFSGYRVSERGYMGMSQYLDARYDGSIGNNIGNNMVKELYTLSFDKQFMNSGLNAYLNYSRQTDWTHEIRNRWSVSVSDFFDIGRVKNVNVGLTAYRMDNNGLRDDGGWFTVSLPWGNDGLIDYSNQFSGNNLSHSLGFYKRIDNNNRYKLTAGLTEDQKNTGSGYFIHKGDLAEISANASFRGNEYQATGFSLTGGMTAISQGIALHRINSLGGTRIMVDTDGVSNIPVHGYGGNVYTNYFGKAVIDDLNSYYRSNISIDVDSLPDSVDAPRSIVQETLTEGAIGYRSFGIIAGEKAMATIRLDDGSSPPFGAEVRNSANVRVGIIEDDGQIWLTGLRPGQTLQVAWAGITQCSILLPSPLPPGDKGLLLPCLTGETKT